MKWQLSKYKVLVNLNNLVGVNEASVDKDGNILYKVWEWKHPA